jgi:hypothetical protein
MGPALNLMKIVTPGTASVVLLEEGDPVKLWRDRLLDCFGGMARKAVAYDA